MSTPAWTVHITLTPFHLCLTEAPPNAVLPTPPQRVRERASMFHWEQLARFNG
jgi:hypothetical protein